MVQKLKQISKSVRDSGLALNQAIVSRQITRSDARMRDRRMIISVDCSVGISCNILRYGAAAVTEHPNSDFIVVYVNIAADGWRARESLTMFPPTTDNSTADRSTAAKCG